MGPRNSTFQGRPSLPIRLERLESPSTRTRVAAMVEDKGLICGAEPDSDYVVTHVEKGLYLKARHVVARLAISVRHGVRPGLVSASTPGCEGPRAPERQRQDRSVTASSRRGCPVAILVDPKASSPDRQEVQGRALLSCAVARRPSRRFGRRLKSVARWYQPG